MLQNVKPGDVVWYSSFTYKRTWNVSPARVLSVGRRWITLDAGRQRADKTTGDIDGGGYHSPGSVYLSREDFEARQRDDAAWVALRSVIRNQWGRPREVHAQQIEQAAALIGIHLNIVAE